MSYGHGRKGQHEVAMIGFLILIIAFLVMRFITFAKKLGG